MAVYEYGITVADIAADFPSAEPEPFGSSGAHGVTVDHISGWITSSSGQISALIKSKRGNAFDVSTLDEDDIEAVKDAIKSAVIAKALMKLRKFDAAKEYKATWDAVLDMWRSRAQETVGGGALPRGGATSNPPSLHWGSKHEW
jgi:hypothetical protein